jgi:hypothetical protein
MGWSYEHRTDIVGDRCRSRSTKFNRRSTLNAERRFSCLNSVAGGSAEKGACPVGLLLTSQSRRCVPFGSPSASTLAAILLPFCKQRLSTTLASLVVEKLSRKFATFALDCSQLFTARPRLCGLPICANARAGQRRTGTSSLSAQFKASA